MFSNRPIIVQFPLNVRSFSCSDLSAPRDGRPLTMLSRTIPNKSSGEHQESKIKIVAGNSRGFSFRCHGRDGHCTVAGPVAVARRHSIAICGKHELPARVEVWLGWVSLCCGIGVRSTVRRNTQGNASKLSADPSRYLSSGRCAQPEL